MSKIEEKLADKAEPILGFRPSSKIKRGRIGIIISIIWLVYVIIELIKSGVIDIWNHWDWLQGSEEDRNMSKSYLFVICLIFTSFTGWITEEYSSTY